MKRRRRRRRRRRRSGEKEPARSRSIPAGPADVSLDVSSGRDTADDAAAADADDRPGPIIYSARRPFHPARLAAVLRVHLGTGAASTGEVDPRGEETRAAIDAGFSDGGEVKAAATEAASRAAAAAAVVAARAERARSAGRRIPPSPPQRRRSRHPPRRRRLPPPPPPPPRGSCPRRMFQSIETRRPRRVPSEG